MCDGYAQSTQHARAVAWLEHGPYLAGLQEDKNARAPWRGSPKRQQRKGRLAQLQARLHSLRSAVAGVQTIPVDQLPASR